MKRSAITVFAIVATASTDNASTPVEVPESTTWLLMSLGLLALGVSYLVRSRNRPNDEHG